MVKELRESVTLILGIGADIVSLVRNSALPPSPSAVATTSQLKGLHVSAAITIILLSMYIKSASAKPIPIDVLSFIIVTLLYFMLAAMFVAFFVKLTGLAAMVSVPGATGEEDRPSWEIDAYTYVLAFNSAALFIFTMARDGAVIFWRLVRVDDIEWANVRAALIAVVIASALLALVRALKQSDQHKHWPSFLGLLVALSAMFLVYVRTITIVPD